MDETKKPGFSLAPQQMLPYGEEGRAATVAGACTAFLPFVRTPQSVGLLPDAALPVAVLLNPDVPMGLAMSREDALWLGQRLLDLAANQRG